MAEAGPGKTVVVVSDGAVGLLAVLSAKQLGSERTSPASQSPERTVRSDEQPQHAASQDTAPAGLLDVVVIGGGPDGPVLVVGGSALLGFVHDDAAYLADRVTDVQRAAVEPSRR